MRIPFSWGGEISPPTNTSRFTLLFFATNVYTGKKVLPVQEPTFNQAPVDSVLLTQVSDTPQAFYRPFVNPFTLNALSVASAVPRDFLVFQGDFHVAAEFLVVHDRRLDGDILPRSKIEG
jgi:hypothetical protein